jgi:hypothetical protein
MPPKKTAKAKAKAPKVYDYSGLEKGMRVQTESDGAYYAAEVVAVSTAKSRAKAPVKISYKGYEGYDEWVGGDRLRSKALKVTTPETEPSEEKAKVPKKREIGSTLPSVDLHLNFPPEKVNILERCKGKRVILVGLPGAFTPT